MKITKEWIHNNKTDNGGWTKRQLDVVGVDWPPVHGWIEKITGKEISKSAADFFSAPENKIPI